MTVKHYLGLAVMLACTIPTLGSVADSPSPASFASIAPDESPAPAEPSESDASPAPSASSEPAASPARTASNAPTVPPPSPRPALTDQAFSLTGDPWECETDHHAALVSTFSAPSPNRIDVRTTLRDGLAGKQHIDEAFVWDPIAAIWRGTVAHGAFVGSAPRWTGEAWTFSGSTSTGGHTYDGRMVFTALGPNAFRRDFELERDGRWQIYSLETCSRDLPD